MSRRWSLAALSAALALMTAPAAARASSQHPPASAGWHGREIHAPHPRDHATGVVRFPRGWSAGAVRRGTGYARPHGSRRVREVQRRLRHRGYRPGPVDGRFGPRTRAAVTWFQIKHGLARTGRVNARTLTTLRTRHHHSRQPATTAAAAPSPSARPVMQTLAGSTTAAGDRSSLIWLLLGLGAVVVVALAWAQRRARKPRRPITLARSRHAGAWNQHTGPWDEHPEGPTAGSLAAAVPPRVIGYVAGRHGELAAAEQISTACEHRGWQLTRLIHDRTLPTPCSPTGPASPTHSTSSPNATSPVSSWPGWPTSPARPPSSPSCCTGSPGTRRSSSRSTTTSTPQPRPAGTPRAR